MEMFFEDTEIDLATALTAEAGLQAIQQTDPLRRSAAIDSRNFHLTGPGEESGLVL